MGCAEAWAIGIGYWHWLLALAMIQIQHGRCGMEMEIWGDVSVPWKVVPRAERGDRGRRTLKAPPRPPRPLTYAPIRAKCCDRSSPQVHPTLLPRSHSRFPHPPSPIPHPPPNQAPSLNPHASALSHLDPPSRHAGSAASAASCSCSFCTLVHFGSLISA